MTEQNELGVNPEQQITDSESEAIQNTDETQFDINSDDAETQSEELDKQIASLNAQRQWEKRKRHEAEERVAQLQEEVDSLNKSQTSVSTEENMSEKYPDWEFMDESQRNILLKVQGLENELQEFRVEKEKIKAISQWEQDFKNLTQKSPELKEQQDKFKEFTGKEEYKNIPLSVLSELFIAKMPKQQQEYSGLEKNVSGERKPNTGLSFDDISLLRKTNPQKYMRLIKEKRLKMPKE